MPSLPSAQEKPKKPFWKKAIRVTGKVVAWLIAIPIILVLLIAVLIYVPPVQNMIRNKAITFLQEKTGTYVELEHIHLRFPIGLTLEGFHMDDLQGDTLVHVGALKTSVSASSLFRQRIVIGSISLEGGRANIHQDRDSIFNFDFLKTAFATPDTVAKKEVVDTTATDAWAIVIEELDLEDLRVRVELDPSQLGVDLIVGEFNVGFDEFSLDPQQVHVDEIILRSTRVHLSMASNDDPREPDTYPELVNPMA
ncbi:MAG: AsmA family protein, partial [Bacteroidota bacterium]|nr:AsmA family protein [Bacteroidota bacterium]